MTDKKHIYLLRKYETRSLLSATHFGHLLCSIGQVNE